MSLTCYFLDNCTNGEARIIGGVSDTEGVLEVCVGGTYYPVSLDNGMFSVREATVICRQLGRGNGMLIVYVFD